MSDDKQRDWCWEIADLMEKFHAWLVMDNFDEDPMDEMTEEGWQLRAAIESVRPMYSTVPFFRPELQRARAKHFGGLLGHDVSRYQTLCRKDVWNHFCQLSRLVAKSTGNHDFVFGTDDNFFLESLPRYEKTVENAMGHATRQSVDQQAMFFEGYAKGLRKGSIDITLKGVGMSTRTFAYQLIAFSAPVLKHQWKSVGDVHKYLEKCLGKQKAGDLKRTENICASLGLKLKNVGRPSRYY